MIPNLTSPQALQQAIDIAYGNSRSLAERERNATVRQLWQQWQGKSKATDCQTHHSPLVSDTQAC